MRQHLVLAAAIAGLFAVGDRASAQVIYYNSPVYYNSPHNPLVRTYSTPVMYSTYTSPIVVPTRFVDPPFGTVAYAYPPTAAGLVPPGMAQPYPAFRQVGYSTYSPAPVPIGGAAYSGDAYIPPSYYRYTPYDYGPGMNFNAAAAQRPNSYYYLPSASYGGFTSPYFQIQFGQGYGGWGSGRGWGGWAYSW
ncbi:MAG TPA: hypothetical protein VHR66_29460 [Gemmataceae bacterium]|jgi:hypothetical protein|nr:hypothetical protein [Gemmataceae bacterium]